MEMTVRKFKATIVRKILYKYSFLVKVRLPKIIVVETTNRCMLKCPTCPTAHAMKRPLGDMSLDTFKRILDQINWKLQKLELGYSGEPLLNRNIIDMVRLVKRRGFYTGFDSNGMLLEKYA
ncbi:MAG: radical SAM protein, partial [Candidatus Omnitrophica bacterium]|nr:radical SAM protein [Candidatus Omnitrophota bacterium]